MNSSVIGKIEKAKRYAQERTRIKFNALSIHFAGENGDHDVNFADDKWHCSCDFFAGYGACATRWPLNASSRVCCPPAPLPGYCNTPEPSLTLLAFHHARAVQACSGAAYADTDFKA